MLYDCLVKEQNMSDYIKREDAIQAIVGHLVPKQYDGDLVNAGFEVAHEIVDAVPSADVMPIRHGHWIEQQLKYNLYKCSACEKVCFAELLGDKVVLYGYCPNCGARMDGGNDE